jgi:hypothetical protein
MISPADMNVGVLHTPPSPILTKMAVDRKWEPVTEIRSPPFGSSMKGLMASTVGGSVAILPSCGAKASPTPVQDPFTNRVELDHTTPSYFCGSKKIVPLTRPDFHALAADGTNIPTWDSVKRVGGGVRRRGGATGNSERGSKKRG